MGRVPPDLNRDERTLVVAEVFGPTFQGEGPSVGRRAGFVRLGRCNLDCSWCDTPYTWDWHRYDPTQELRRVPVATVLEQLRAMAPELVVVTGGEPLLQPGGLVPFLEGCAAHDWPVEIETNGTIAPPERILALVTQWNVSPKLANSGVSINRRLRPEVLAALRETGASIFKFVVTEEADLDEVAALVEAHRLEPVWIMPEGTDPATLLEHARQLAEPVLDRGWNLTPRLHVLLWGDQRAR